MNNTGSNSPCLENGSGLNALSTVPDRGTLIKRRHFLTQINEINKTAICSIDGLTKIRHGKKNWECYARTGKRHILTQIDEIEKTAMCSIDGLTKIYYNKKYMDWRCKSNMIEKHILTQINEIEKTAICAICGQTNIYKKGNVWICHGFITGGTCMKCRKYPAHKNKRICKSCIKNSSFNSNKLKKLKKSILVDHYSQGENCCEKCGETDFDMLNIDHVNGGGVKHRKQMIEKGMGYGVTALFRYLRENNFPNGYRVLCENCNWLAYLECLKLIMSSNPRYFKSKNDYINKKNKVYEICGGAKCKICECSDTRILVLDHINGGGKKHSRMIGNNLSAWAYANQNEAKEILQVLCRNCNAKKNKIFDVPLFNSRGTSN